MIPFKSRAVACGTFVLCTLLSLPASAGDVASVRALGTELHVGDLVFTRIDAKPFREVAKATGSWTNHVGIVLDVSGDEPVIGESKFPLSGTTTWARFVGRSDGGRVAVLRLASELTPEQQVALRAAAVRRAGVFYDTGFDIASARRQFCSRYVREVLIEASGTALGEVETFGELLARRPDANLGFWKLWYFGSIPWQRRTVTPASVMRSPALRPVFDGVATSDAPMPPATEKAPQAGPSETVSGAQLT